MMTSKTIMQCAILHFHFMRAGNLSSQENNIQRSVNSLFKVLWQCFAEKEIIICIFLNLQLSKKA